MSFFRSVLGLLPAAIVLVAVAGCPEPPQQMWKTREARVLGVDSDIAEDPVSGRMLWKSGAIKRDYLGTIYYFESSENAEAFDRDPRQFAVIENVPPKGSAEVK